MTDFLLCLSDATGRIACFLQVGESGMEYVSGTPGSSEKIAFILRELGENGVHVRAEYFSSGRIDVDRVRIDSEDPRYLDGCADEFRLRGWKACVYPRQEAELWRKLFELPVPQELRTVFAERLGVLPKEALVELRDALDRAAADLEKIREAK